ncbi:hypothetical protein AB0M44_39040 [Streptosporangium subroseum]|uniref:hypothetical protein n=1 Tax=Streptosporangium subroseum TaxID=106412 RepID=UPI00344976E2
MATGLTATELHADGHADDEVSDARAEEHDRALAVVQRLLKDRGVRSFTVHTYGLKLFGDARPLSRGGLRRLAPELVVHRHAGWTVATVSVGSRSGSYLVSISNDPDLRTVREPQQVADLILAARPGGGA